MEGRNNVKEGRKEGREGSEVKEVKDERVVRKDVKEGC